MSRRTQVTYMLREAGWNDMDAGVHSEITKAFRTCGQTSIVENAFNRERGGEILKNFNKRMSHWRRWSVLLS